MECVASKIELDQGVSLYLDFQCLVELDPDCSLSSAGCRYCQFTPTPGAHELYASCPDHALEQLAEYTGTNEASDAAAMPVGVILAVGCSALLLTVVVVLTIIRRRRRHYPDQDSIPREFQREDFDLPPLVIRGPTDDHL